jgi:hypothetical protein
MELNYSRREFATQSVSLAPGRVKGKNQDIPSFSALLVIFCAARLVKTRGAAIARGESPP